MKRKEVRVGGVYIAKVNGRLAPVRVTGPGVSEKSWRAVNLLTGRKLYFRSSQKLRREVPSEVMEEVRKGVFSLKQITPTKEEGRDHGEKPA